MLDYGKFVTKKGSKIETHFEDEVVKVKWGEISKKEEKSLIRTIDMCDVDNGKQSVHLAINSQMAIRIMSEDDFSIWQSQSEKDWFHIDENELGLPGLLLMLSLGDLISDFIYDNEGETSLFTSVTMEEYDILLEIPGIKEHLITIAMDENCGCCPSPYCRGRNASFDKDKFDKLTVALNKK